MKPPATDPSETDPSETKSPKEKKPPKEKSAFEKECIRDAIVESFEQGLTPREAAAKHAGITMKTFITANKCIEQENRVRVKLGLKRLAQNDKRKQIYRWASAYMGAAIPNGHASTKWEKNEAAYLDLTKLMSPQNAVVKEFGVSKPIHCRLLQFVAKKLGFESAKEVRKQVKEKNITRKQVREAVDSSEQPSMGRPTYFSTEERAMFLATFKAGEGGFPMDRKRAAETVDQAVDKLRLNAESREKWACMSLDSQRRMAGRLLKKADADEAPDGEGVKKPSKSLGIAIKDSISSIERLEKGLEKSERDLLRLQRKIAQQKREITQERKKRDGLLEHVK